MKLKLNLNDQVKVRLTKRGLIVLNKYCEGVLLPKPDENGYYKFSLWELANIFGNEFHNGQMKPSIVNNEIVVL